MRRITLLIILISVFLFSCEQEFTGPGVGDSGYTVENSANRITINGLAQNEGHMVYIITVPPTQTVIDNMTNLVACSLEIVLGGATSHTFFLGIDNKIPSTPWKATGDYYIYIENSNNVVGYNNKVNFSQTNRNPTINLNYSNTTIFN